MRLTLALPLALLRYLSELGDPVLAAVAPRVTYTEQVTCLASNTHAAHSSQHTAGLRVQRDRDGAQKSARAVVGAACGFLGFSAALHACMHGSHISARYFTV